jgi:hypothetical protein
MARHPIHQQPPSQRGALTMTKLLRRRFWVSRHACRLMALSLHPLPNPPVTIAARQNGLLHSTAHMSLPDHEILACLKCIPIRRPWIQHDRLAYLTNNRCMRRLRQFAREERLPRLEAVRQEVGQSTLRNDAAAISQGCESAKQAGQQAGMRTAIEDPPRSDLSQATMQGTWSHALYVALMDSKPAARCADWGVVCVKYGTTGK